MFDDLRKLNAGPLTMHLDVTSGFLRSICLGEVEIVRGIYAAVRDHNWNTIEPRVSNLQLRTSDVDFRVAFDVDCSKNSIHFRWHGEITGQRDGTVSYCLDGESLTSFLKNRVGFCVLHPILECAGEVCTIEHPDGTTSDGHFPQEISAHQPFKNIRAIRHRVADGQVEVEVRMEGDIFEMEDQRNWTDASYKTYCTPLELPFPVPMRIGEQVKQSVTLSLRGTAEFAAPRSVQSTPEPLLLPEPKWIRRPLPARGLGLSSVVSQMTDTQRERIRLLHLDHLRLELDLDRVNAGERLELAGSDAKAIDVPLVVAICMSDPSESQLTALARAVEQQQVQVSAWIVFHRQEKSTQTESMKLARRVLKEVTPQSLFVGGTAFNFAELNRQRPDVSVMDAVVYSINPQVHAFDDASLIETLQAQPDTLATARAFCEGRPIWVGPITLRPRLNPNATGSDAIPGPTELPPQVDPRQSSLFAAAWTLGTVAQLTAAGADRITFYETVGWRGVIETDAGPPDGVPFSSVPGGVYPVYHLFADIAEFTAYASDCRVAPFEVGRPAVLRGLAVKRGDRQRWLIANLTRDTQTLQLPSGVVSPRGSCIGRILSEDNLDYAMSDAEAFRASTDTLVSHSRLSLPPYAVARIDTLEGGAN